MSEYTNYCDHPVGKCLYDKRMLELEIALYEASKKIFWMTHHIEQLEAARDGGFKPPLKDDLN